MYSPFLLATYQFKYVFENNFHWKWRGGFYTSPMCIQWHLGDPNSRLFILFFRKVVKYFQEGFEMMADMNPQEDLEEIL